MATRTNRDDWVPDVDRRLPEWHPGVLHFVASPFRRYADCVPTDLQQELRDAAEEMARWDGSPEGSDDFLKFQRADDKFAVLGSQVKSHCQEKYHSERRLQNWLVERKSRLRLQRPFRIPSRRPTVRSLGTSRTPRTRRPTAAPPGEASADPDPDPPDPPEGWLLRGAA